MSKYIDDKQKFEYFQRLIEPYTKKNVKRFFIDQYLNGDGNELKDKFWNVISSSRLAFDLYSWIPGVEFEFKLPGVICSNKGAAGVPNMDVYIETDEHMVFIESKYTESAGLKYCKGNNPALSKAYWDKGIYNGLPLQNRFYGRKDIGEKFCDFCAEVQSEIDINVKSQDGWKWFDVKQETCHLFGIIMYALNARKIGGAYVCDPNRINNKKISLCNIIWKLSGDDFRAAFPMFFKKKAEELVNEVLGNCFSYEVYTVQDLLIKDSFYGLDFKNAKAFGLDIMLDDQMKQYNLGRKR